MDIKNASTIVITGNTFPVKTTLRQLGADWDKETKQWTITMQGHPSNNMRGRSIMANALFQLAKNGCRITYR